MNEPGRRRGIMPVGAWSVVRPFGNWPGIRIPGPVCGGPGMPFAPGCPVLLVRILTRELYDGA